MKYDFDKIYDRKNTNSLKFDFAEKYGRPKDILPLWVADMDFKTPEEVINALTDKAHHGIFGYSEPNERYFNAVKDWFSKRHGWKTDADKYILSCGVVFSICALIRALTNVGDSVLICQPVYYPFSSAITDNGRKLVVSELCLKDGLYTVDYNDFERKIIENNVKLFILCNPHNPVGRVWTKEELNVIGDICLKHGVFVISDEIHADFVYGENVHTVFPTVKKEYEEICAVCTAPTKTFNLAGLHIANTYIYNDIVRAKLLKEFDKIGYSQSNIMGITACQTAYTYGENWLEELKTYLTGNLNLVRTFLKEKLPQINLIEPQGTYLIWLDCRGLGLSDRQLKAFMIEKANLWLENGYIFGKGGNGFQRINIACPRKTLEIALNRILLAVRQL